MTLYIDTSAALKLLVAEAESDALVDTLREADAATRPVASLLLATELHCAARRRSSLIRAGAVEAILRPIGLVDLQRQDLRAAPRLPAALRTNDAIHLATAIRLGVDTMLTYDLELADAARTVGIEVLAPA